MLGWFLELDRRRQQSAHGYQPLTYHEVAAWARLTRTPVTPRDIQCLMACDDGAMIAYTKLTAPPPPAPTKPAIILPG